MKQRCQHRQSAPDATSLLRLPATSSDINIPTFCLFVPLGFCVELYRSTAPVTFQFPTNGKVFWNFASFRSLLETMLSRWIAIICFPLLNIFLSGCFCLHISTRLLSVLQLSPETTLRRNSPITWQGDSMSYIAVFRGRTDSKHSCKKRHKSCFRITTETALPFAIGLSLLETVALEGSGR